MKNNIIYIWIIILIILIIFIASFIVRNKAEDLSPKNNKIMNIENLKEAYFAGGCFWCMEWIFESQEWVKEAIAWYIGWSKETATYNQVSNWNTKHREWVKIIYDPKIISYEDLVELYWRQIDPIDPDWQFADKWFHYTTAIYYSNQEEKNIAEASKKQLDGSKKFDKPIVTSILESSEFYDAEEYHQDYYKKSSTRYKLYEKWSGRKDYKEKTWGSNELSDDVLKNKLTPLQYKVTQKNGTENPFDNEYWDNKIEWIYVDLIDGTPLYSSLDKYVSWTGWPSFTKPIDKNNVVEKEDNTLFSKRTEIRSKNSDSHLWHVFPDWPDDKWWLRYCMNSAAMKFIPVDKLEKEWYGEYLELFNK